MPYSVKQLKKYLRVNHLKLTDNFWLEIHKNNIEEAYSSWQFEYKLEYKE